MSQTTQIISTSLLQALLELRANKLRTFLSLLGITIGIFCIIAVLTVLDSMKNNISNSMSSLGSDVIYIGRWPWTAEEGDMEYKWWEFMRRPSMTLQELRAVERNVHGAKFATLCFSSNGESIKYQDEELKGISAHAVTEHFDQVQNIEIQDGRYLTSSEINGGNYAAVIGYQVYLEFFPGRTNAIGKSISFRGKKFVITGVLKKSGQNMAGFDFDNCIIYPYIVAPSFMDVESIQNDPFLMVKAADGVPVNDLKYEVEGVLRIVRKVAPGEKNNFAINQLSQIAGELNKIFGVIDVVGWIIGGFSLLVGSFGIANIMFVTVRERRKFIGLKKAIGARPRVILIEFLIEAVALCIIGGLAGIIIVFLLSLVLTHGADFPVTLSLKNFLTGMTISAVVGILAGIMPAYFASRLDPVVAIRST